MLFGTRARNVFGRNTNLYAMAEQRSRTANPPLPAPQFRLPQRYSPPGELGVAGQGPYTADEINYIKVAACIMANYLSHQLDKPFEQTAAMVASLIAITTNRQPTVQAKEYWLKTTITAANLAAWCAETPPLAHVANPSRSPRRSVGAPRTVLGLAAAGAAGENCWWTGYPDYAKCCTYDGIAIPFCVTYPDVE